jgi:hypothetical protein
MSNINRTRLPKSFTFENKTMVMAYRTDHAVAYLQYSTNKYFVWKIDIESAPPTEMLGDLLKVSDSLTEGIDCAAKA